ncbi:cadherin-13-like [Petromyzon marinus]|uniref:cadherin-13-like n=1 Tax=Petromyzon marinus TaxID=7757 RepID=UPI003F6F4565
MRVVASDMDDPLTLNGAIRYHIVLQVPMMTAHRVFTIDRFTGIITNTVRLDREPLDFETSSSYQLIVFVDNEEPLVKTMRPPPESTATVTVSVEDENEAPLFEPRLQQVMLAEGLALGSAVTTLVARDPDTAQKQSLRYRKLRVPGDWLDIDAAGGAVSTAAELDRESPLVQRNVYTATFLATDDGSPVASGTATLELLLSDVNDNAPTAAVWPRGTAACPRTGVAVVASDADEDPNGRPFRFRLAPGGGGDADWTLRQVDVLQG